MSAKQKILRIFRNGEGTVRPIWRMLSGIGLYAAAFGVALGGLGIAFNALFRAWGIDASNVGLAPVWAQNVVLGHGNFMYLAAYGLSAGVGLWFAKRYSEPKRKNFRTVSIAAAAGFGMGILLIAAALLTDGMRLERPLTEPSFSWMHISTWIMSAAGCFSQAVLMQRLVMDAVPNRTAAYLTAAAVYLLLGGRWSAPLTGVNAVLMGVVGCAVYEKGGLMAAAALRFFWLMAVQLLFSEFGTVQSVYRMYYVSDAWFNGGFSGLMGGVGCTLCWGIPAIFLFRREIRGALRRAANFRSKKKTKKK